MNKLKYRYFKRFGMKEFIYRTCKERNMAWVYQISESSYDPTNEHLNKWKRVKPYSTSVHNIEDVYTDEFTEISEKEAFIELL